MTVCSRSPTTWPHFLYTDSMAARLIVQPTMRGTTGFASVCVARDNETMTILLTKQDVEALLESVEMAASLPDEKRTG